MRPIIIIQWIAIGVLLLYSIGATLAFESYYQPARPAALSGNCTYNYAPLTGKLEGVTCH